MKTKKLIYFVLFFIPIILSAQWSNDPMVNTYIAGSDYNQLLPKIAVANNGSYYISSFVEVGPPDWYNVYLHKLDANGNKLWDEDGLLVSPHDNRSWISDYNLITDQENSAILTFADIRAGTGLTNIYGYRISTSGDFLWGNDGVTLSDNLFDEYSPKAIVTEQGNFIFAWTRVLIDSLLKQTVVIQKVSSEGQLVWGNEIELINSDSTYCEPFLVPAENDNFIAVWCRLVRVGSGIGGVDYFKYIYAQKFDSDGNEVWPDIVAVCDLDTLANCFPLYVKPVIESDNNNGVFVSWFDCHLDGWNLHTYVQHIDADGNAVWTENGVITSLNYGQEQVEQDIEYIPASDELCVFWIEYLDPDHWGISGQKLSNTGQKMWGDNGLVIEPLSTNPYTGYCSINAELSPENDIAIIYHRDSLYVSPPDTLISTEIFASLINEAGQFVWDDEKIVMSSYPGWKISMDVCDFANDQWVAVWIDDRPDLFWPGKLYAQNVQLDGELGPSVSVDDVVLTFTPSLKMYPNPFNPSTTIKYTIPADEKVKLSIYNIKGQLIKTLIDETQIAGEHSIIWNGRNESNQPVSSGIYFYKMETKNISEIKKCVLLK